MIDFIVVFIIIMLCRSFAESAGKFWKPAEFENMSNPYFENLNHLQHPGHLLLTAPIIYKYLMHPFQNILIYFFQSHHDENDIYIIFIHVHITI